MQTRIVVGWALLTLTLAGCDSKQSESTSPRAEPPSGEPAAAMPTEQSARTEQRPEKAAYELDTPTAGSADAPKKGPPPADPLPNGARGPSVTGEGFEAFMAVPEVAAGKSATARVVLDAVAPFHCNDKYPYKFTIEPTPGVTYPSTTLKDMQIGERRSTMAVPFTVNEPGKKTLTGELSFSVCTDDKCLIEKQKLTVTVDVEGAS